MQVFQSVAIFSIPNNHCFFMGYYYLFGVFYFSTLLFSGFKVISWPKINQNAVNEVLIYFSLGQQRLLPLAR